MRMPDGYIIFTRMNGPKLENGKAVVTINATDPMELVMCKHCKHGYYADNRIPSEQHWACALLGRDTIPDGYCHLAEKEG